MFVILTVSSAALVPIDIKSRSRNKDADFKIKQLLLQLCLNDGIVY